MFRLLGFLLGSTVAIATILFILGIPKFNVDDAQLDTPIKEAAVEEILVVQRELAPLPEQETQETTEDAVEEQDLPVELPEIEMRWYSFWNPFRSEIAAQGFVSQLEEVTGLDYRIVKVKAGVYEVAFAYIEDTERTNKLEQISAATGLDLTES
jgi:hypothetical protein